MAATERFAVAAEDIRHLQRGTHRPVSGRRCYLEAQSVEWAWSTANGAGRDLGVARRGVHVAMAEQRLDDADIGATLQQVGGEAVAQCVNGDALAETRRGTCRAAGGMQHDRVDRMLGITPGKQPVRGSRQSPIRTQDAEQLRLTA